MNIFDVAPISVAVTVFMAVMTSHAYADDSKHIRPAPLSYCADDRASFCSDKKEFSDIASCLIEHDKVISTECKQDLDRFIQMKRQALSSGGGLLTSFGGPPLPSISYDGRYGPGANSAVFSENRLNITAPLHKSGADTVSLSLTGGTVHLGNPPLLDSGRPVPTDLYRLELGVQYFSRLPENRNWGLRVAAGSAGDKPFATLDDTTFSLIANYGFPGSENGTWKMSLFFSNNSPIGNYIPIPGFTYLYKSETFTGIFGLPVASLQWTPVFPWSFSFGFFGPNIHSEAGYGSIDRFQVFSGFYWSRQNYIPSERVHAKDRLTIEEKRAAVGIRTPIWESMLAEFQLGRAFDRWLYIGNGPFNKDGGSTSIPADWYLSTAIKLKY